MRRPIERLELNEAWGMSSRSAAYVYRPVSETDIRSALDEARAMGLSVALRGGGNSYGDAFQNAEGIVIDLSRMNRILAWDSSTGVIVAEPGLTIQGLWRHTLPDGWWPPVVSGTSFVTLGGALSANIHGKNNWHAGPLGEHVLSFELLLTTGEKLTCSQSESADVFRAAIGGFGLLGVVTQIRLQMKRLYSGLVRVDAVSVENWDDTFRVFETRYEQDEYLVGWIDCIKGGAAAGRGLIHAANYIAKGEDAHPEESLNVAAQQMPDTVVGIVPRSRMHKFMSWLINRHDMGFVNMAKYFMGKRESGKRILQPIVPFNFLLDSAPNWKLAYKPGSLIQFQPFVPRMEAKRVFAEITNIARERGFPAFLGVMKRHRPDSFLLSHAVDGYSLALDFPVFEPRRDELWRLCEELAEIAISAGGRFYWAKDSTLTAGQTVRYLGADAVRTFGELKGRLDPEGLLETELSRRLLGGQWAKSPLP